MRLCNFLITAAILLACLTVGTKAQDAWSITKLKASDWPATIVEDTRKAAPSNGLPDGKVTELSGSRDIVEAWYALPTTEYGHAVLGDAIEAKALRVKTRAGVTLQYKLPRGQVFEDITPRLMDLDQNGTTEVITIHSSVSKGAAVTIFELEGGGLKLEPKATTGFIGTANRWLNIAGISNFIQGQNLQIALVATPHIGGKLQFLTYKKRQLNRVALLDGFSNHVIGSRVLDLSGVADIDGNGTADLAIPSQDRKTLNLVGQVGNRMEILAAATLPSPINKAIAVERKGKNSRFIVGLEDDSVYAVHK